ncbi:hypothetical protein [Actinomadura sp. 6K520]|uniref:hypothetical protein n=1 Tax=Actinomadura sp. 6K520 TaxID=2530364 RepID=UPI001404B17C|nr:hypothetical protein [Actinomadura sp. 6K520]
MGLQQPGLQLGRSDPHSGNDAVAFHAPDSLLYIQDGMIRVASMHGGLVERGDDEVVDRDPDGAPAGSDLVDVHLDDDLQPLQGECRWMPPGELVPDREQE